MVERLKQVRDGRLGWGLAPRSNGDLCRYSDYADLERQIAELRAKEETWHKLYQQALVRENAVTAERDSFAAENARLRALPLKDEVERVLERAQQKMRTYVGVYPGDKELRELLSDWDALLSRLRAREREGWRLVPVERIEAWISYLRQRGIDVSDMEGWLATVAAPSDQGGDRG